MATVPNAEQSDIDGARGSAGQLLSELVQTLESQGSPAPRFGGLLLTVSDDSATATVRLCTGSILDVPTFILKNVVHRGTLTVGGKRCGLVAAEIDESTALGRFARQLSTEVDTLSRALAAARKKLSRQELRQTEADPQAKAAPQGLESVGDPWDTVQPPTAVKLSFDGIAGNPDRPAFVYYQAPPFQYIQQWEVIGMVNCYFQWPPIVGSIDAQGRTTGLQFFPDAQHGTPLGTAYSASIIVNLVLVQLTT